MAAPRQARARSSSGRRRPALAESNHEASQARIDQLATENAQLREQIAWFKRQLFGPKSEKRTELSPDQIALFIAAQQSGPAAPTTIVPAHERRKHRTGEEVNDTGLRFGPEVPMRTIRLSCPELDGPQADQYEVIGVKESLRLARQPGSPAATCCCATSGRSSRGEPTG